MTMPRHHTMFAAVKGKHIECLNRSAKLVREEMGGYSNVHYGETLRRGRPAEGWRLAKKDGWRVARVAVRVLD